METKAGDKQLTIRLDPALVNLIRKEAAKQDKTPSQLIREILAKYFRQPALANMRPEGRPRGNDAMVWCDTLSIAEAKEHEELWKCAKALLPDLTDGQTAKIVSLVIGTCRHCHANGLNCTCTE